MDELWNEFDLKKPPLITIRIRDAQFAENLHRTFNEFFKQHAVDEEFAQTAALLSRLMARRKNSFSKLKGFKSICKLNAALCRLLRVDLPRVLENFRSTLPDMVVDAKTKTDVPTRNSLDYVLLRLLAVHKLHQRINECCADAAEYLAQLMRTNFFLEINTLLLAVIAKLSKHSQMLSNNIAKLYAQLYTQRQRFPHKENYEFLPQELQLPEQLELISQTVTTSSNVDVNIANSEDVKKSSIYLEKTVKTVVPKLKQRIDMGVSISRETLKPVFDVDALDTVDAVRAFIASEQSARKGSQMATCTTKRMQNHEWNGAVKLFEKKLQANEHTKALIVFRKIISHKI